ncbi:CAP64-like protein [Phlegmacium glaucopus]|nr:CAP64-like protein [Phlegmacium glaucopus]
MGMNSEKAIHRPMGLRNRIWIFLIVLVFMISVTYFIWPLSGSGTAEQIYSNADLKSKNYFNETEAGPNPFTFCPNYGPDDVLGNKYGTVTLSNSIVNLGSGTRIQRVLNRALAGQPVTISILGGSVSACHGSGDDPISPKCYPSKFFQWWNTVFPHPASELTNGAMRRTSSNYFGYCNSHHLPDVTDMVIIELDTEDSPGPEMMENFEILIRSILIRPDQPAVLVLGHFSPQVHDTHGFVGPDHWHTIVAQFYDVPHVTIKPAVLPEYTQNPTSIINKYYVDPVLANTQGHDLITDILVSYFQSQICTAWSVAHGAAFDAIPFHTPGGSGDAHGLFGGVGQRKGVPEHDDDKKLDIDAEGNRLKADLISTKEAHHALASIPARRMNTPSNPSRPYEEIAPYCVSANDLINPLPPSLFYGSGWYAYHPSASGGNALYTSSHYWYSTLPTSKIRIPLQVGAGDIGIYYLREPISKVGEGSSVECWVDDNYGGAKVIENAADIAEETTALRIIDHMVTRGSHFVECQLLGEEGQGVPRFKIIGVFST